MSRGRRGTWLLALGAAAGVAIAAGSLLGGGPSTGDLPEDVIATVDGRPILRAHYERALAAVASDRREGLTDGDRQRVLDRLVDEELLIGRALELGMASRDPKVRNDLSRAMLDVVRAAESDIADEATLRAFYEAHADRFRRPPRLEIEHAWFTERSRAERAVSADRLEGADAYPLPIPDGPLALSTITRLLGPTAARTVAELAEGEIGGPFPATGGHHVVRVVARHEGALPAYEEIEGVVREHHARIESEARLRALLEEERARADIVVAER